MTFRHSGDPGRTNRRLPADFSATSSRVSLTGTLMLLAAWSAASAAPLSFTDVTASAGILHGHSHNPAENFHHIEYPWLSGGAVAEDFDGDGWIDLYVLQGGASENLLYINQGDGTFVDEAAARGADLVGAHCGASAADFDGDGDIDIALSSARAPHPILVNDGSGNFSVGPHQLDFPEVGGTSPSWADIDNDGLLDLAMGAWGEGIGNFQVYRNMGPGGLQPHQSIHKVWAFVPHFADMNGDGFQDMFGVADFGNSSYYLNEGNSLLRQAGTSDVENGMGVAAGDIDNDGDLDIFISSIRDLDEPEFNWGTTGNRLLRNDGGANFTDITDDAGVRDGNWGWGSEFADFDNDGDLDLYHVNGWPASYPTIPEQFNNQPARLFENLGGNSFQDVAQESGAADDGQGRCAIVFDFDNDGDQDIFVANNQELAMVNGKAVRTPGPPRLYRNDTVDPGTWLKVRAHGRAAPHHSHGLGARVYCQIDGGETQLRELNASSGFNGHGPERIAHFGLGEEETVDRVTVRWPNGDATGLRNVATGQEVVVSSPLATTSARMVSVGESVELSIAAGDLPKGAWAVWTFGDGGPYQENPAVFVPTEPGVYDATVWIYQLEEPHTFHRSESLRITVLGEEGEEKSIAQQWNEQNLAAVRIDFPNPTKHARNLFHTSAAMWDAWAAYDEVATGYLCREKLQAEDVEAARREAISHAAYRILAARYSDSVNASTTLASIRILMNQLGYDPENTSQVGDSPAELGNRIGAMVLAYADGDGASDYSTFMGGAYATMNDPLPVAESGSNIAFPNHWQPLLFEKATTQNGQVADVIQSFLGPNWGGVRPFALPTHNDRPLFYDPGPPPRLGGPDEAAFKDGSVSVIRFSSLLDPSDGELIDISPGAYGNNPLGSNDGKGHAINPVTGEAYPPNVVKHGDFGRILAEFWADGPDSETPPGHWNVLANELHEHPHFERRFQGVGEELGRLEWDVKLYFAMNGALHDAAISAWGCKRVYDYVRPISSIRYLGSRGQSSDPSGPSYDPSGLPLIPGLIEVVTAESSAPGGPHEELADHLGEVAIRSWRVGQPVGGVHWILAVDWLPYQRATFVTPAFPGYVSGHSTFSRAAAEVLAKITGSEFFPGGLGTFTAPRNEFLHFEDGPTEDVVLQWATYYDAADQAGISRLYGGIHVPVDDGPGRVMGSGCGLRAWELASSYYDGSIESSPMAARVGAAGPVLTVEWDAIRGVWYKVEKSLTPSQAGFTDATGWMRAEGSLEAMEWPLDSGLPERFFRVVRSFEEP